MPLERNSNHNKARPAKAHGQPKDLKVEGKNYLQGKSKLPKLCATHKEKGTDGK